MKKFLCFGVLIAAMAAAVGCEEKKSTGGTPVKVSPTSTPTKT